MIVHSTTIFKQSNYVSNYLILENFKNYKISSKLFWLCLMAEKLIKRKLWLQCVVFLMVYTSKIDKKPSYTVKWIINNINRVLPINIIKNNNSWKKRHSYNILASVTIIWRLMKRIYKIKIYFIWKHSRIFYSVMN